jgi:ketosteroid isomerase-like protein
MAQKNVEIAQRAMDAFNRSNLAVGAVDPFPWLREFCDPDIELDLSRREVDPEVYCGYEEFARRGAEVAEVWKELHMEVQEVIDAGESVVLFTHNKGVARSGVKLGVAIAYVLTFRAGKIIRWVYFGEDRPEALKAVGLEE